MLRGKSSRFMNKFFKCGICFPVQDCWKGGSWRNEWPSHSSAIWVQFSYFRSNVEPFGQTSSSLRSPLHSDALLLLQRVQGEICIRARFLSPQSELWKVLRADGEGNHPLPPLQTLSCVSDLSFLFLKVSDHYANVYCKWTLPFPWSQDMRLGLIWKATWTQIWKGKVQAHIPVTHSKGLLNK